MLAQVLGGAQFGRVGGLPDQAHPSGRGSTIAADTKAHPARTTASSSTRETAARSVVAAKKRSCCDRGVL